MWRVFDNDILHYTSVVVVICILIVGGCMGLQIFVRKVCLLGPEELERIVHEHSLASGMIPTTPLTPISVPVHIPSPPPIPPTANFAHPMIAIKIVPPESDEEIELEKTPILRPGFVIQERSTTV